MKGLVLVSAVALSVVSACKERTYNSDSATSASPQDKNYEEVACAFFCPGEETPSSKLFKAQRGLCEGGKVKPFGNGLMLEGKLGETVVSRDLSDVALPKCMGYKTAVLTTHADGLWLPDYPALTAKLNKKEIFKGKCKLVIPVSAALTDDGQWGVLRVNDESFLIKKNENVQLRSPNALGQYLLARGYPDEPQTSPDIKMNLFRRHGSAEIECVALNGVR